MANQNLRIQGVPVRLVDSAAQGGPPNSFYTLIENIGSLNTPDASIEIQGYRIQLSNDSGTGGLGLSHTTLTSANDPSIECQGYRIRIHPTGNSIVIGGISTALYALCMVADNAVASNAPIAYLEHEGDRFGLADTVGDGKFLMITEHTGTIAFTDHTSEWWGVIIDLGIPLTLSAKVPPIGGIIPTLYDSCYFCLEILLPTGMGHS